ncbi:TonB-dependent receptor domain-containing protein, partial [Burkholderia sola]|uniref:TonB-dependent receptor domain-containing protein n=1 Tax=Burkholderia sola TaxID=2843302 RepID=UPI00338EBEC8
IGADGQFRFPFTSPGFFELHGAKADAARFADHELLKRVHPEDLPALAASVQASVGSKDVWEHKYRVYGPDGELRWLHGHARPQREEDGSLLWHGYVHDVTQDQAMQESIRHSEGRLRLTVGVRRQSIEQSSYDYNTGAQTDNYKKSATTPMLGLVFKTSENTSVYANYIEGLTKGAVAPQTANDLPVSNGGQVFAPYKSR